MIYIASDHAGFKLKEEIKEFLAKSKYKVKDLGPFKYDKDDDYPDYALKVCKKVSRSKSNKGILVCGLGHGMNIVANKVPNVYATICWNESSAIYAKTHTNVNVICIPARIIKQKLSGKIIIIWLKTEFEGEKRHIRRINKIKKIEKKFFKK